MRNWLTRDPIGERGGLNLYEAMRNNPANYVDLLGLLTAVFIGGPSSLPGQLPNPFGHATIAFSGQGTYSFGTVEHFASSFPTLNDQAAYRGGTVYVSSGGGRGDHFLISNGQECRYDMRGR